MTVFVDTGVLYADHDRDATRHETAATALEALYDGEFGTPYVSDYVYDEVVTLTARRTGSIAAGAQLGKRIRGVDDYPAAFELCNVSSAIFSDAIDIFETYDDQQLSFTDATTVALIRHHDFDQVLSFDDDFDGLVPRLNPHSV